MDKSSDTLNETGIRILIVDDEKFLINMWTMSLKRRGYIVNAYASSLAALEVFKKNPLAFDIVITDQTMPQMTGGVFAAEILKIRKDIPVVICTGYSDILNEEQAKMIGISEYLMKPFDINHLESVIKKLMPK